MSAIVVGYDGSDCAKGALAIAADTARAHADRLVIAFAYELHFVGGEIGDYHHALSERAQSKLEEALALVADSGVELEPVIMEEAPAKALVELAEGKDARMIVVGTRGEGPWRGALIGSTPHKLLQLSPRPVLVVPLPQS